MRRALLIAALAFVAACSPRLTPPAEIRDSVRVEIRERLIHDSVPYYIEKEVERVMVRDTASVLENKYAKSEARVDTLGFLHHSLESKAQVVYVPYEVYVRDTTYVERQSETIIKEVERQLTKWQSFSMVLGWMLGALLLLAIILWIIRKVVFKK